MDIKTTIHYHDVEYEVEFGVINIRCTFTDGSRLESVNDYDIVNLQISCDGQPVTNQYEWELVADLVEQSDKVWDMVEQQVMEDSYEYITI